VGSDFGAENVRKAKLARLRPVSLAIPPFGKVMLNESSVRTRALML
jgi:hypothetical protein